MSRLTHHPEASAEARHALRWYLNESEAAAVEFWAELDAAYDRIREQPSVYPSYLHGTRRKILSHFPYSVIFRELAGTVEIIAVAHAKRKPGYWSSRLKSH